ncbi:MAG: C-GCAxxG-C-C family protein [Oxalobacter formigenes]|nr:C-GCAxxG-C-C family protein [Oxalobacter formigenes]
MDKRIGKAVSCFHEPLGEGRRINCAQAIALAYAGLAGLSEKQALDLAAGFGRGMGKRQTCGAVAAMLMVAGLAGKIEKGRRAVDVFEQEMGSTLCSELLWRHTETVCPIIVRRAAELLSRETASL